MKGSSRQGWAGPQGHPGGARSEAQARRLALGKSVGSEEEKKCPSYRPLPQTYPIGQSQACGPLRAQDNLDPSSSVSSRTATTTKLP